MIKTQLDSIDKRILRFLQQDGTLSNVELAEHIGLSPTPCARRVKALYDSGWIERTVAIVNPKKLGLSLTAMVQVTIEKHTTEAFMAFENSISMFEEVLECYLMTGQSADYQLKVMVEDMDEYQKFILHKLTPMVGITAVHSSFVMRRVLDKIALPIN